MATEQLYWRKVAASVLNYCYYEKVLRTMRTAIVMYLPKQNTFQITKSIYVLQ